MNCFRKSKNYSIVCVLLLLMMCDFFLVRISAANGTDAKLQHASDAARKAWKDDAFGIFIHWGPSTIFQGRYNGKEFDRDLWGEWFLKRTGIPQKDYEAKTEAWNPAGFNAREWLDIFKDAGARYMVFVAKHHDGFALFDCDKTPYNIVDFSKFPHDVFKDLSDEARRHDIKPGFYYSHGTDWRAVSNNDKKKQTPKYKKYFEQIVFPHLKQLCGAYGKQNVVWFDLGAPEKQALECVEIVRSYNPDIMISSRVGPGDIGDFSTGGDQSVPAVKKSGCWETCMTLSWHWAWYPQDRQYKSPAEVIQMLARIRARGGNLLLNIGPDVRGKIPTQDTMILKKIGEWLRVNGEAVYGVRPSPYNELPWGVCVTKPGKLYAHVLTLPTPETILLPGLKNNIKRAYFLAGGSDAVIPCRKVKDGWELNLSKTDLKAKYISFADTVLVIEYEGDLSVDTVPVLDQYFPNKFIPATGQMSGGGRVQQIRVTAFSYKGGLSHTVYSNDIAYNLSDKSRIGWHFNVTKKNKYMLYVDYANRSGKTVDAVIEIGGQKLEVSLPPTTAAADDMRWFNKKLAGTVELSPLEGVELSIEMKSEIPKQLKQPIVLWDKRNVGRKNDVFGKYIFMIRSVIVRTAYPQLLKGNE